MALEDPQKNIVCVFLIVNSYLNCLKVDRIQDNEEEKKNNNERISKPSHGALRCSRQGLFP